MKKHTIMKLIIFVAAVCTTSVLGSVNNEKMKLEDLKAITLYDYKMAASRRSKSVPQLVCVGGSAGCSSYTPKTVLCKNEGWDGYSIQWECKADMPLKYSFGDISVVCEGYDYPEDPYILKGSCSLEYTIDFSTGGNGMKAKSSVNSRTKHAKDEFDWSLAIVLVALVMLGYIIYTNCLSDKQRPVTSQRSSDQSPDIGWNIPNSNTDTNEDNFKGSSSKFNQYGLGGNIRQQGHGGGGGFWTGLASGGVLGYLFGSRTSEPRASNRYTQSFRPMNEPDQDDSNTMRMASAYGGTKRR